MSQWIWDVRQFHRHFGHPIASTPTWLTPEREAFRVMLVDEECGKELKEALAARNMNKVADAIADSIYVLIGMALEMGIPITAVWNEVQAANMRKAVNSQHHVDCKLRLSRQAEPERCTCGAVLYQENGKTAKPPGWEGPDRWIEFAMEQAAKKGTL